MAETTLRSANVVRRIEWTNGEGDKGEFYAVELFGEAGEALNVVKKLERERQGWVGSRATSADLAEELADVVICIDLLAMAYNLPPVPPAVLTASDAAASRLMVAVMLGRATGEVMGWVEEVEDSEFHFQWHHDSLSGAMGEVIGYVFALAQSFDIDIDAAVVAKFNKTSAKYGLETQMAEASLL